MDDDALRESERHIKEKAFKEYTGGTKAGSARSMVAVGPAG